MKTLVKTFVKLLGNGRAWLHPKEFMLDFYEVLISPLHELKEYLIALKSTHFPTKNLKIENILNGENQFGITHLAKTTKERANNVELEWSMFAGNLNFKTLEKSLQKAGLKILVRENTLNQEIDLGTGFYYGTSSYYGEKDGELPQYGAHFTRVIGNGFLNVQGSNIEPAQFKNGKNTIYLKGWFEPSESEWEHITEIVLKLKPGHTVAICDIAERKVIDNEWYNTTEFKDEVDGGTPEITDFFEYVNAK
ncbi:hypothetical protein IJX73_02965 [bacterium]|nr:hypothetical protein [bacterium]